MEPNPIFADGGALPYEDDDVLGALVAERWDAIKTYFCQLNVMVFLKVCLWFGKAARAGENRVMLFNKLKAAFPVINRAIMQSKFWLWSNSEA